MNPQLTIRTNTASALPDGMPDRLPLAGILDLDLRIHAANEDLTSTVSRLFNSLTWTANSATGWRLLSYAVAAADQPTITAAYETLDPDDVTVDWSPADIAVWLLDRTADQLDGPVARRLIWAAVAGEPWWQPKPDPARIDTILAHWLAAHDHETEQLFDDYGITRPDPLRNIRVPVEVPAAWVGLLCFGVEFDRNSTDQLGRRLEAGPQPHTSATPATDDDRPLPAITIDGVGQLHITLKSGDVNYYLDVILNHPTSDTPDRELSMTDTLGPARIVIDDTIITLDWTLTWPTDNQRATAVDTLKRGFEITKAVAGRIVTNARWDLLERHSEFTGNADRIIGSIALGHQSADAIPALVTDLLAADVETSSAHTPDGIRADITVTRPYRRHIQIDARDWTTVTVDDTTVPTGLPVNGGPDPVRTARRVVALLTAAVP